MSDERLSEHFYLSEFTRSDTAARLGIAMVPTPDVLMNLRANATGMEQVRGLLRAPIHVLSGWRPEALEAVLCEKDYKAWCRRHSLMPSPAAWRTYFERKKHPWGLATDFVAPAFGPPSRVCRAIAASSIGFDQLIFEHTWTHIAFPRLASAGPRREVLTLIPGGYAQGIIEGIA